MSPAADRPPGLAELATELGQQIQGPPSVDVIIVVVDRGTGGVGWAATTKDRARVGLALKAAARSIMD